jgi:UDP-glucuronate decarboxylase
VHPQNEEYNGNVNTMGPRSCYDEGKRLGETLCYAYSAEEGVETRIARIFNTYGPRMRLDDGRVVSNFITQALQGQSLTVYGEGSQTRSFQYVSDLVIGLIKLMNSEVAVPVNLGNPDEYTIGNFATKIIALINPGTRVTKLPATEDDPQQRKPDISRAKKLLDWEPRTSIDEGLYWSVKYFREELNSADLARGGAGQLPAPDKDAAEPFESLDSKPLWVAAKVNAGLTDHERGVDTSVERAFKPPSKAPKET